MWCAQRWIAAGAIALACWGMAGAADGQPQVEGVRLQQLSFDSDHTGLVPDSEYGQIVIGYLGHPNQVAFMNITAQSELAPEPAWLLRNLELLPLNLTGEPFIDVTTLVDLGQLGVERGLNAAGSFVALSIQITPGPLFVMPPMQPGALVLPIEPQRSSKGGRLLDDVGPPNLPFFPERPVRIDPGPVGGIAESTWRIGLDAPDVGHNQCAPASVAASFHWLQSQYPDLINLHGQTFYETLAKLKEDMRFQVSDCCRPNGTPGCDDPDCVTEICANDPFCCAISWDQLCANAAIANCAVCGGVPDINIIRGKMRFIQRQDKSFAPGWQVRYQGGVPPLPATVQEGGMVARRIGGAGEVSFDFIEAELKSGADVEVHISYLSRNAGGEWERDGGHSLAAKGTVRWEDGKLILYTADDGDQNPPGDKPSDVNPGNGGIRNWNRNQLITLGPEFGPFAGGIFLSGEEGINVLDFVSSERPPAPDKPKVTDCVYASDGNVTFTAGIWTLDGTPIGKTFPGNITPPAGEAQYDTAVLPESPNDWHWSAIVTLPNGESIRLDFDFEGIAEGDELHVPLFVPAVPLVDSFFDIFIEVSQNSYSVSGADTGTEYHTGAWSLYPKDLPPDIFFVIDAARGNFVAPPICVGDLNGDCRIDADDLGILLGDFGCTGPGCVADLDGSLGVDADDLGILLGAFGAVCDCACDLGPCPGDLNGDGLVNNADLGILLGNLGCVGPDCLGDLNCDGVVDDLDVELLQALFGSCD